MKSLHAHNEASRVEAVLEALERGENPKPGSQTGRQGSMPASGRTTLQEQGASDAG